jgi:hypothetical protein
MCARLAKGFQSEPQMGIYKRGKVYWIDFYGQDRQRVQESSHGSSRRDAKKLYALRKSEILRGIYKRPVKVTLGEFGERYMEHAKTNKRSWLRDEQMLGHLTDHFGTERQLTDVTPVEIEGYKVCRRAEVSGSTVNHGWPCSSERSILQSRGTSS